MAAREVGVHEAQGLHQRVHGRGAHEREAAAPVGAYRSDAVQPMPQDEVRRMVAETFDTEREPA